MYLFHQAGHAVCRDDTAGRVVVGIVQSIQNRVRNTRGGQLHCTYAAHQQLSPPTLLWAPWASLTSLGRVERDAKTQKPTLRLLLSGHRL